MSATFGNKMSATFDTLTAARELEAAGMDRKQADAVVGAIRESRGQLVSIADLSAFETRITATLYRALWIQAAGIIATITALAGIAIGLASLWSGQ